VKPVTIIAVSVACSVAAVLGVLMAIQGFATYQDKITFDEVQTGVDPYNCQVWVVDPDTNKPRFIDEYNEECLEFISLPLTEQYEIYEQEKPIIKTQIDRLCMAQWEESQNESIFEYLVDHTSCLELLCPIDIISCKVAVGEVRLIVDGMKNESGDIIDVQKFEERDEECWESFFMNLEEKRHGNDNVINVGPWCWYLLDEFEKLGPVK